jgi:hypothetical protein
MPSPEDGPSVYVPNFVMPRHGAIREDNWQEYVAKGFFPVPEPYDMACVFYGFQNVYTGQCYSATERRPLRHLLPERPEGGVYTNQDGLEHVRAQFRDKYWFRDFYELARRVGVFIEI